MKVLYLDWPCFCGLDMKACFKENKINYSDFYHEDFEKRNSDAFLSAAQNAFAGENFDYCFSFNYFPLMATACYQNNIKYISVVFDSPQVKLFSKTVFYPTNHIFIFDSETVNLLSSFGVTNVYYLPLPVNGKIIDYMISQKHNKQHYITDVSFVGALYNESNNLYDSLKNLNPYTRGYLKAIMNAQSQIYGAYFLDRILPENVISDMKKSSGYVINEDGFEPLSYIFADYYLCRKITSTERVNLINKAAQVANLKLYTLNPELQLPNVKNMGPVDYYSEMPYVFKYSKINLNISLRSIRSGIPLRCMDIMGAGGFLLSNYQSDFLRHFVPNEDFVFFEDAEDMQSKIEYYLSHEKERKEIAANGHHKVLVNHNFTCTLKNILNTVSDNYR